MAKMDKDTDKKSMDVSKPGKSMPDLSARPVIVTHRPMVQDPMVKSEVKTEEPVVVEKPEPETDASEDSSPSHEKKVIKPISDSVESSETTEEPKKDEPTEEETAAAEAAVVEAVASQAQSRSGKKAGEPSAQDMAKQEHLQKLITDKTYFVSVGQATRRRNRRNAAVLLIFMLMILAGGYAAIDAGIIASNIELPVDLIKN